VLLNAGSPPNSTVELPGLQGAGMLGTQGAGVKNTGGGFTVAGFAGLLHIPKVGMFAPGLLSMIVARGPDGPRTVVCELTTNAAGAVPKGHTRFAPILTHIAITLLLF